MGSSKTLQGLPCLKRIAHKFQQYIQELNLVNLQKLYQIRLDRSGFAGWSKTFFKLTTYAFKDNSIPRDYLAEFKADFTWAFGVRLCRKLKQNTTRVIFLR